MSVTVSLSLRKWVPTPRPVTPSGSCLEGMSPTTSILELQPMKVAENFRCWVCKLLINFPVFNEVHSFIHSFTYSTVTKWLLSVRDQDRLNRPFRTYMQLWGVFRAVAVVIIMVVYLFFSFGGCPHSMWKFLGQVLSSHHSSDLSHNSKTAGSLTTRLPGNSETSLYSNELIFLWFLLEGPKYPSHARFAHYKLVQISQDTT